MEELDVTVLSRVQLETLAQAISVELQERDLLESDPKYMLEVYEEAYFAHRLPVDEVEPHLRAGYEDYILGVQQAKERKQWL